MKKKVKKIKPYGKAYMTLLIEMIHADRSYYPCNTCGRPVRDPYVCIYCGETDP